jgi:hypothetical protein
MVELVETQLLEHLSPHMAAVRAAEGQRAQLPQAAAAEAAVLERALAAAAGRLSQPRRVLIFKEFQETRPEPFFTDGQAVEAGQEATLAEHQ